ncbi:hypothetical protein D3C72_2527040 [compost metagenome]
MLAGLDFLDGGSSQLVCAHLRLQVISSNLRGADQHTLLARQFHIAAAAEEEGYVGILFGFSSTELLQAVLYQHFT